MIYLYLFGTCFHFIYVFMIIGNYYSVWLSFANYLIVFFILQMMYKHRIFLKI